jgi:hypothetical protein
MQPNNPHQKCLRVLGFLRLLGALNRLQGRRYANGEPDVGVASPKGVTRIRNPTYKICVRLRQIKLTQS